MTVGATEAIAAAVLGLVEPGSEVLLIEPFYDSYSPVIAMAGCERRAVPLIQNGRGFAIDVDGLRRAVTPKTKALIVNSPHNPTGMVASDDELQALAQLAVDADLLVITDEVYEHLVFDGHRHIPLANYPGMAGPHGHDLQRGQDVQLHRLEDRMGLRRSRTHLGRARRQAIPVLRRRRAVSAGRGPCTQHRGGVGGLAAGIVAGQARQARLRPGRSGIRGARQLRHLLLVRRSAAARGIDDSRSSVRNCRNAPAWRRSRCRHSATRVPTTPTRGITWCASPSASATTPSMRRSAGCRCCVTSRRPRGNSHRRRRCRPPRV